MLGDRVVGIVSRGPANNSELAFVGPDALRNIGG